MKAYKRTRIIASLAVLSSLTLGGVAMASTTGTADNSAPQTRPHIRPNLHNSQRGTSRRFGSDSTSNVAVGTAGIARTPHIMGTIQSLNGPTFTVTAKVWNRPTLPAGATTGQKVKPTFSDKTYTVNTTPSTVFMKDGKLDSLTDLAVGDMVMITGTIDSNAATITATGVHERTRKLARK